MISQSIQAMHLFQEIENLHSKLSLLDNVGKWAYLRGQWHHLNQMAMQMSTYIHQKGYMSLEECTYTQNLINMIRLVEQNGMRIQNDVTKEILKELAKNL